MLLLFFISLSFSGAHLHVINVTEENELEQFLCYNDPPVVGDTLVVLYTNITHYISGNVSFCMINTTYSLNITSNSSGPAIINCNQTGNHLQWPTTGFSFINVPSLTLQRLVFRGCGGFLKNSTIIDIINSTVSPFHFTQYQSAVLLSRLINILLIENVTITSYYGFAILAINPMNATMNGLTISVSIEYFDRVISELGSGALLYFTHDYTNHTHTVIINNSLITKNIGDSYTKHFLKYSQNHHSVLSAGGLTVLYTQTNYSADVSIFKTNITRNFGNVLFFLHYKTNYGRTVFDQVSFVSNMASGMVLLIMIDVSDASSPLLINSSVFNDNVLYKPQLHPSSVIFIGLYNPSLGSTVNINFNNSVFMQNNATTSGSCIYATDIGTQGKVLNIFFNNITAHNNFKTNNKFGNTRAELIKVDNANMLHISGYNNFSYNFGSIFVTTNTKIHLNGQLNIIDNNGYMGTGFKVQGSSYFLLSNGLNATFINNTALTIGGAIYAIADDDFQKNRSTCMFQTSTKNITNIKMTFIDNTASEAGSSIYSNNLHGCDWIYPYYPLDYNTILSFSSNHRNISIPPTSLCLCNVDLSCNTSDVNEYNLNAFIRPGQNIQLQLAAVYIYHDIDSQIIQYEYAAVTSLVINCDSVHSVLSWQVSANSANQALLEKQDCTSVTVTLLKNKNEPNPSSPAIIVSSGSLGLTLYGIQLLDCPIGFELNAAKGKCVCSRVLYKLSKSNPSYQPDCHISSEADNSISTITRTATEWIGIANLSNGTVVFGAALNCLLYCRYKSGYTKLKVNDTNVAIADYDDLNNSVPLCIDNREGLLCSQCPPGYSVVFGSYECKQCSNWWLFTLIIYAVIGPLLIYLMYVLKLTLTTGTLNGIIFCVQVLGFIDPPSVDSREMNLLLNGWSHIDLKVSLCLYNGMTELWKQGLLTMYQVYILSILLGIIVLSRFSVKISNKIANSSVQILVTVVHVSFSYLLTSIMEVFTPVTIYTNNTEEPMQVWFKYPTVEYGTHGHLVLMIITSLVVGPILGVYMTVLLAGRPLMRINYRIREYIRPVYEAIHAPYKWNKEFFFVSRLLIVILLYVIYTCFRGKDILLGIAIASPMLSVYIAVESMAKPFKRMSLNIFNLCLLSFLALIYGSSWYFMKSYNEDGLTIVIAVSNVVIIASLLAVIIMHILWVTGLLEKIKIKFRKYWSHCLPRQNQEEAAHVDMIGSFFEPFDRVREPLLSSQHSQYH